MATFRFKKFRTPEVATSAIAIEGASWKFFRRKGYMEAFLAGVEWLEKMLLARRRSQEKSSKAADGHIRCWILTEIVALLRQYSGMGLLNQSSVSQLHVSAWPEE